MSDPVRIAGLPLRGVLCVLGSFCMAIALGGFYTFGNMMPYIVSYMRNVHNYELTYSDFTNVQVVYGIAGGLNQFLCPLVYVPVLGNKLTVSLGCLMYSLGPFLAGFFVDQSFTLVLISMGIVAAFGEAVLIPMNTMPMRYFPERRGTVSGMIICGVGISSFIFNPLQLAIVNPDNVEPKAPEGSPKDEEVDKYFENEEVLSRVPTMLFAQSAMYASLMLLGWLLLSEEAKTADEVIEDEKRAIISRQMSRSDRIKDELLYLKENIFVQRNLYLLFLIRLGINLVGVSISTYYKAFALSSGKDDKFITFYVGTVTGFVQVAGRLVYGFSFDYVPFKILMGFLSSSLAVSTGTLYWTPLIGSGALVAWLYVIYFSFPGGYAILPAVTLGMFGETNGAKVLGILAFGNIFVSFAIGAVSEAILHERLVDYMYFFLFVASGPTLGVLATMFVANKNQDEKKIARVKRWFKGSTKNEAEKRNP